MMAETVAIGTILGGNLAQQFCLLAHILMSINGPDEDGNDHQ